MLFLGSKERIFLIFVPNFEPKQFIALPVCCILYYCFY